MSAILNPPMPVSVDLPPSAPMLTAEEFFEIYSGQHAELVRGFVQEVPMPSTRHGEIATLFSFYLTGFVLQSKLGRVCGNDSLFVLRRKPDTVRGPDVSYYSFARMPAGPAPTGVCDIVPELVAEVKSPSNTWADVFTKIGEYLRAGVLVVIVLDPDTATVSTYRPSGQQVLGATDTLTLPDLLPGFAALVQSFFE